MQGYFFHEFISFSLKLGWLRHFGSWRHNWKNWNNVRICEIIKFVWNQELDHLKEHCYALKMKRGWNKMKTRRCSSRKFIKCHKINTARKSAKKVNGHIFPEEFQKCLKLTFPGKNEWRGLCYTCWLLNFLWCHVVLSLAVS